jgi:hypothetical protein
MTEDDKRFADALIERTAHAIEACFRLTDEQLNPVVAGTDA